MAWDPPLAANIEAGDVVDYTLMEQIRASLIYLKGELSGISTQEVRNGNFEVDSDGDGVPDGWTDDGSSAPIYGGHAGTYPGGNVSLQTSGVISGSKSIQMVHPGGASNGGGLLESDFMECNALQPFPLGWVHGATAAGMLNQVALFWYTEAKVYISTTYLYSSANNPTSYAQFIAMCVPPASANYFTIGLVGGNPTVDVAGTAVFDGITKYPTYQLKLNLPALGTIAEATTVSGAWVSLGTVALNCPIRSTKTIISANISGKTSAGGAAYADLRLGVGTDYSNTITTNSTSYVEGTATLITDTLGSDVVLTLYGMYSGSSSTVYGKMDAPAANFQMSDEVLL